MEIPPLKELLTAKEGEGVEFKEAKGQYSREKLEKYLCALANEGGGLVVFGVSDKRPRRVVGTNAFEQPERTRSMLMDKLGIPVDFAVLTEEGKRVLIFSVSSRPAGVPVKLDGVYWGRQGDSLLPISEPELRAIFSEAEEDFSADVCPQAGWDDLDPVAIEEFRRRWVAKSRNNSLESVDPKQLLVDAEAVVSESITYAGLILFGTYEALGKHLGQAEVIFEYRSGEASGPAQQREEFRRGFFSYYDRLWELINLRNDRQHFEEGLFLLDIPTFDERAIREAVLNAVSHRDYRLSGSTFIRQYPRRLTIESPGGLPIDITPENIIDRQSPRNRRIADIFSRCGLVERSGQGMNLIYESSIREGKPLPDLEGTDRYRVVITLHGQVEDLELLRMMEEIGQETLETFSTHDFLLVSLVHRDRPVPDRLRGRVPRLLELGILERAGRSRLVIGSRYYRRIGRAGAYTRKRGLQRETKKELILQHIRQNRDRGTRLGELLDALPGEPRSQVQVYLRELRDVGRIYVTGATSGARWYPTSDAGE